MLKSTVKRGLMVDFINDEIPICAQINLNRVFKLNNKSIKSGGIIYIMTRELRLEDNWAIIFAQNLAEKHKKKFKIVIFLDSKCYSKRQKGFIIGRLDNLENNLHKNNIQYEITQKLQTNINAGAIIVDFNPISLQYNFAKSVNCAVFEVDSHNIIPARYISDKQEFSAATMRRKVYSKIAEFLTEFPRQFEVNTDKCILKLNEFIDNKLNFYAANKNDPNNDVTSNLSPYLHCGFISAQRIAIEIFKSKATRKNKEAYLEELVVRKELADNFCLYNQNYKTINGFPSWAKETLNSHKNDIRSYIYGIDDFLNGNTHDELWNKIQQNLLKTGKIHGYLRMYWAKKILEWTPSPEEALNIAVYLNDEFALDGNDPNGYVGILWSLGGLHDRPFSNRLITGKIRYMSFKGCKSKFDVIKYIREGA